MNIRINDTPVDFTLEHETTFAHLHRALTQWAQHEQVELLSVMGDGRALSPDDETLLAGLNIVEVEAVPASAGALARLAVVARFFALVAKADGAVLEELKSQYRDVKDVLPTLMAPLAHRLTDAFAALDGWSGDVSQAAARVSAAATTLHRELSDPHSALSETLDALEKSLPGEELSQLFQRGQDRDGFGRILALFTAFEDFSRCADLALATARVDTSAWTTFQEELRPFLGEARDALDAADQILLTDLLEYEIAPRLSAVRACFSNLDPAGPRP